MLKRLLLIVIVLTVVGIAYSRTQRLLNPAAYVEVYDAKGERLMRTWAFSRLDLQALAERYLQDLPYRIRLVGMKAPEFTGLQINYDPGMPVAYGGFVMMLVGFLVYLFFKHKVIWVRFDQEALVIGGMARNNPKSFEQEFEQIVRALQVRLNARTGTETETETQTLETVNV